MKLPPPTTVSTVPPYRRLTAVKAITATVLQNVRRLTATTAGTGTTTAVLTAASPIGATVLPSARPVMPTTAGTKRRFRCRPTPTARPTTPTAPPNVPPGAVTQVIQSQEARALKTILLVLRITVQKVPGFLDAPAMIPAQAAEGVIISVIFAGDTEQEPLAAAAVRIKARWALTPVDKLSDFQKTKGNHKQAPRLRGLLL